VGGFAGLNVLAYRHAYSMMHFAAAGGSRPEQPAKLGLGHKLKVLLFGLSLPRPQARCRAEDLSPSCTNLTIPVTNSIKLGAWYCPAPAQGPLVILFHGYASEKSTLTNEARAFLEMGCSVLLVDFRGSGDSSESCTTVGFDEAEDVAAAVCYAKARFPHTKLVLYGQSMGAVAVLRAVHCHGIQPDGVVAEAVFDRMLTTVRNRFALMKVPSFPSAQLLVFWGGRRAGFNAFNHNPVEYAASVKCPILFLHGTADPDAHLDEGRRVFDAVPGRKTFTEFPRLGHEASIIRFPTQWREAMRQFLIESN
jgi:dipeptidyl aminopeptidase/acylaminoacyl peptidase